MMMMMIVWCLETLSIVFESYHNDGLVMQGSVQWSTIQSWAEFLWNSHELNLPPVGFEQGTSWSEVRGTNHSATWMLPRISFKHMIMTVNVGKEGKKFLDQAKHLPSGCTAILDTHLQLDINFLDNSCLSKLYTLTYRWVWKQYNISFCK